MKDNQSETTISNQREKALKTPQSQQQTKMVAMAAKVEWTWELVETLIESVDLYKVIWDTSSASYKNKTAQETAWCK